MIIIVCLDDNDGMRFNNRRQSRDLYLCQRVAELSKESVLWVNAGSNTLFEGLDANIRVDPQFLELAESGEYCFVEDRDITEFLPDVEKIIIFRWNRVYPSDMKFPMYLLQDKWHKEDVATFPGKSHELITQEVYLP